MSDLDRLRSLGEQIHPPTLGLLRYTARRRARRGAVAAVASGLAAVLVVAAGALAVSTLDDDRTGPEPIVTPTPSPFPTPSPTPDAEPTHQSETSMTPREVVAADNAALAYAGVAADDTDLRVAVWSAECTWCPKSNPESQTRPFFHALAVTTDGFETASYARPPRRLAGIFYVHSPAPGTLLIVDDANGGEWLVHEDASTTLLPHVVEERETESPRQWFHCLAAAAVDRIVWCAYDDETETVYERGGIWTGEPDDDISAVSPGVGDEPWGRERLNANGNGPLTAYWYEDGVRRTRTLIEDFPFNSRAGSVLGADEGDLLYWSLAQGDDRMKFYVGDDRGQSWRVIDQSYPAHRLEAQVDVLSLPDGTLILREVSETASASRTRLWRLDSLEEGNWTLVHDVRASEGWTDNALENALYVLGSRLVMGSLHSDDDGRTWTTVDRWR